MIYNIAKKTILRGMTTSLRQPYGELSFTHSFQPQSEFTEVPTFRAMDLDGKLLDPKF
jgi:hypothetical protein